MSKAKFQVKFYSDKGNEYRNKLFCFKVNSRFEARKVVNHFKSNGNVIRVAYFIDLKLQECSKF